MAAIAPTPVDPAPSVPDSSLDEPTFDAQFEAFLMWLADDAAPGFDALAENVYDNAVLADAAAGDAETAKNAAEDARDIAVTAKDDAETARGAAEDARDIAVTAKDDAETAKGLAEDARDIAVPAAETAVDARDLALAYRDQAEVFSTQQLKASSTTTLTPGAGTKNFTIETGRSFVAGMYLVATSAGATANAMSGYVTSYDGATGALVIAVDYFSGASARSDWVIGVAAPGASAAGLTRSVVSTNTTCVAGVAYIVDTAGIVLTLPTSWTADDQIEIIEAIGFGDQYSIAFGSTPVRGRTLGTQVIDASFGSTGVLTYQDATQGLV